MTTASISTVREGGTLVARADGRVDGANAREFQDDLTKAIEADDQAVVLDLENLSYISSAGLRVILMTARKLREQGSKFAVCSLSASIKEVFEISGFDKIISIQDSQAEAIAALND